VGAKLYRKLLGNRQDIHVHSAKIWKAIISIHPVASTWCQ
jgi:hypothetical protein